MKRLRWPGLANLSMVWTVASGRTMLMRLLMGMRLMILHMQYIHKVCVCQVISRGYTYPESQDDSMLVVPPELAFDLSRRR